jgi:hypothetical protein
MREGREKIKKETEKDKEISKERTKEREIEITKIVFEIFPDV